MGINVSSGNWSKLGNDNGINIDSKIETESQDWESGSHSHSSSISLTEKLANLSKVWNWSSSNLCDEIDLDQCLQDTKILCSYQYE